MSDTTVNVSSAPPPDPDSAKRAEQTRVADPLSIALYVNNEPVPITIQLPIGERVNLGRNLSSDVPPLSVDLTTYMAFERGVSRVHAALERLEDGTIVVEDLVSSNGTHLNGLRLKPHVKVMLTPGSHLLLAQLGIQVYFQSSLMSSTSSATSALATVMPGDKAPEQSSPQAEIAALAKESTPDTASGRKSTPLQGQPSVVKALAFSPDGKFLVSGGKDSVIQVWDVTTSKLSATLQGEKGTVNALVFSPDGKFLVSGGEDGVVQLWEMATNKLFATLQGEKGTVNALVFSPDGKHLVSAGENGVVQLWEMATSKLVSTLQGPTNAVYSLVISPEGKYLAAAGEDATVHTWALESAAKTQ